MCHHHGKIRGPLLNAPHHPEELCGAPLDAAQHPEELCTIDSLDLFLEHSVSTLFYSSVWLIHRTQDPLNATRDQSEWQLCSSHHASVTRKR